MVRLLTAATPMEARIIAARLGAEGIVWDFRGSVDGLFPLGPVEILVDEDGLDAARDLMLADDVESSFVGMGTPAHVTTARDLLWAALAVVGLFVFAVVRMAARV